MATIGETARMRISSAGLHDVSLASDLEDICNAVWLAARAAVDATNGTVQVRSGRQGVTGQVNLTDLLRALLPEASKDECGIVGALVRQTLTKAGAAKCIDTGQATKERERATPTWWVADDMPATLAVHVNWARTEGRGHQEFAIIQDEARARRGGPRVNMPDSNSQNGPVTSSNVADRPAPTPEVLIRSPRKDAQADVPEQFNKQRQMQIEKVERARAKMVETVKQASAPLTPDEIFALTDWSDTLIRSVMSIGDHLRALTADGVLYRRLEETAEKQARVAGTDLPLGGRRAYLYAVTDPVPARTQKSLITSDTKPERADRPRRETAKLDADKLADAVLDLLETRPMRRAEIRTALDGAATPASEAILQTCLDALMDLELITRNGSFVYSLADSTPAPPAEEQPPAPPADELTYERVPGIEPPAWQPVAAKPEPTPPAGRSRDDKVNSIMSLVRSLVADDDSAEKLAELQAKNDRLEERIRESADEIQKLRKQVAALKGALLALE